MAADLIRADDCPECDAALVREEHLIVRREARVNNETVEDTDESTWTVTCENGHHWTVEMTTNTSPKWRLAGSAACSALHGRADSE